MVSQHYSELIMQIYPKNLSHVPIEQLSPSQQSQTVQQPPQGYQKNSPTISILP